MLKREIIVKINLTWTWTDLNMKFQTNEYEKKGALIKLDVFMVLNGQYCRSICGS